MRPKTISDDELIAVARATFIEHGGGVSTNVIAREAGVSQGTLFKRFGTKEELMKRALGFGALDPLIEQLERGPTGDDIKLQLVDIGTAFISGFARVIPQLIALRGAGFPAPSGCLSRGESVAETLPVRARSALASWLSHAQAEGRLGQFDVEVASLALLAAFKAPSWHTHMFNDIIDVDGFATRLIDGLWVGIQP